MNRVLPIALFLSVATALTVGLHVWFYRRLVRDPGWSEGGRLVGKWALVALCAAIPVTMLSRRFLPGPIGVVLAWPAFLWMGAMFFLSATLGLGQLVSFLVARARPDVLADPERRRFFHRGIATAAASVSAGLGAYSVDHALAALHVHEIEAPLPRLPPALDGTTIVQLTDVHIGPTIGRAFIEEMVRKVNALRPDLIAITGDLVDGSVEDLAHAAAPLADLRARHGVYFVTGNHEYYSGADRWIEHLATLGVRVLRNERVAIGEGERGFDLLGIDDHSSKGLAPGHGPDLERAAAGRDTRRATVLLAHQPRAIRQAEKHAIGLQLSGHTHGGQLWPWTYLVYLQQPIVEGLKRVGETLVYVSPGTGYWGPPMRFGTQAEITRVTLRAPEAARPA